MLHKRKQRNKPLKSFTQSMLHSKSTYFYKQWFLKLKAQIYNSVNGFGVSLSSSRFKLDSTESARVNRTRLSQRVMNPYGGITKFGPTYLLPCVCLVTLLLVLGCMVSPVTGVGSDGEVYAAINEDLGNGSTISLTISNNGTEVGEGGTISTEVEVGQLSYISNSIKVTTNKIGKYYIGIQAASDGSSELVGLNNGATIAGVGSNVSTSSFGDNTWGYVLTDQVAKSDADLAYSTLPSYNAGASPQYQSVQNPTNGEHELKLTFAAKIRADKPADHYQTKALVSVAAEAREVPTLGSITYMQDIDSEPDICKNTPEADTAGNNQYQLIDKRDNKTYWVAKLKDGNCWMTQNLDLDIPASGLNKDGSNLETNWDSASTYKPVATQISSNPNFAANTAIRSWDPALGGKPTYCNDGTTAGKCKKTGNPTTSVNDGHDAQGNYYSFEAATAGQGSLLYNNNIYPTEATQDICPKGWRLPQNQASTPETTIVKSYRNLLNNYGWIFDQGSDPGKWANGLTATQGESTYNIKTAPFYFIYTGSIYGNNLENAGSLSRYWSSAMDSRSYVRTLGLSSNTINPSKDDSFFQGNPIRCVAR